MNKILWCFLIIFSSVSKIYSCDFFFRDDQNNVDILVNKEIKEEYSNISSPFSKRYELRLETIDKFDVPVIFFDRQSDKVLVIGQGFPGGKEDVYWYAKLFDTYDVIIFDYRWKYYSFMLNPKTLFSPIKRFLLDEKEEVNAVVNFLRSKKNYKEVVGLGFCYSVFTFIEAEAAAQRQGSKLFSKLILDSAWFSFRSFADSIISDPLLPLFPQTGYAPDWLKSLLQSFIVKKCLQKLSDFLVPDISLKDSFSRLVDIPILFVHGKNDLMVPLDVFEKIWEAGSNVRKAALLTPFEHSNNAKNAFVYKFFCEQFIQHNNFADFLSFMHKSEIFCKG